jgi:hypothetical protein
VPQIVLNSSEKTKIEQPEKPDFSADTTQNSKSTASIKSNDVSGRVVSPKFS